MTEFLSDGKRRQFEDALSSVYMAGAIEYMDSDMSEGEVMEPVNSEVDGKSVDEIIEMAENSEARFRNRIEEME